MILRINFLRIDIEMIKNYYTQKKIRKVIYNNLS